MLVALALNGVSKDQLLALNPDVLEVFDGSPLVPAIAAIASGSYRDRGPPEIRGSGYVVHTLEAVLWALNSTNDFRSGLLKVVNLGEDADTTGAVYGQLAGAIYGMERIPPEWTGRLAMRDQIEKFASELRPLHRRATWSFLLSGQTQTPQHLAMRGFHARGFVFVFVVYTLIRLSPRF